MNIQPPKHKQIIEIDSREGLELWLAHPEGSIAVQSVVLDGMENALGEVNLAGSLFLGCQMSDALAGYLVSRRAFVIPADSPFQFPAHRATLYTPDELFDGFLPDKGEYGNYHECFDQRVYQEYETQGRDLASIDVTLSRRLHDHSMTDARDEFVYGRKMVAIMGGHDLLRGSDVYRQIAELARTLARDGFTLTSGGGPGAMEATHVGAYFAPQADDLLDDALEMLSQRRGVEDEAKEYKDKDWLQRAYRVRQKYPLSEKMMTQATSLAIPTWFYGHEPPAPFATHIAKYFANSVREDGLLQIARHGVIFAPGNAGTVQEIFQDAAQNYYQTFVHASPMVLLGKQYWQNDRPAWELLKALAETPGKEHMQDLVHLTDDPQEAIETIRSFSPAQ